MNCAMYLWLKKKGYKVCLQAYSSRALCQLLTYPQTDSFMVSQNISYFASSFTSWFSDLLLVLKKFWKGHLETRAVPLPLDGTEVELVRDPDCAAGAQRRLTVHSRLPGLDLKISHFKLLLLHSIEYVDVIMTGGFEGDMWLYEKVTAVFWRTMWPLWLLTILMRSNNCNWCRLHFHSWEKFEGAHGE